MKKIIIAYLLALPVLCVAQQNYTITVNLKNINPQAKAYLYYSQYGKSKKDTAVYQNNQFVFHGTIETPLKAFVLMSHRGQDINASPSPDQVGVYLESGNIVVNAPDSLIHATVEGTALNNDQQELNNLLAPFRKQEILLNSQFSNASKDATVQNKIKEDYIQLTSKKAAAEENFIRTHPKSLVSFTLFRSAIDPAKDRTKAIELFNLFPESLQNTNVGLVFKNRLALTKTIEVGNQAPSFTAKNPEGEEIALSSFQGKYVLVDFWASWCAPCRQENPNVVAAYNKYKGKNFTVLGVSLDDGDSGKQRWIDAIKNDKLPWEQVSDLQGWQSAIARMYSISAIPANFLLDPNGKIIARDLRGEALNQKLSSIL